MIYQYVLFIFIISKLSTAYIFFTNEGLIEFYQEMANEPAEQKSRDLSGLVGETVELPCAVDTEKCGELHSIKWYRASSRIYVFSEMAGIARSENDYTDRAELQYTANSTLSYLRVKRLQVSDEAVYKCEITYLEVLEGCQVVQFINLTTLIKPEYMKLTREDGSEVTNSSVIGPLVEGDSIVLRCESGGGKPIPSVTWWNGSFPMAGTYDAQSGSNGIGTGVSVVSVRVGRGDLSAKYECRSQNNALPEPIVSWVEIDVNVRPLDLKLTGIDKHVIQGEKVKLQCIVRGARPPANITWYNGTEPLPQSVSESSVQKRVPNTTVVIAADGTYDTQSYLEFVASRFENDETLSCEASNAIMRDRQETPMRDTHKLEVMYPPIVTVTPENYTEKEGTDILLFCQYEANPATLKSATWRKDNEPLALDSGHYEGGTPEQTTLLIKNSTRKDHGIYSCILENEVGASESISKVNLSIHFKPIVNVTMDPPSPVSELDRQNISLLCQVVAGNPDTLTSVIWYLDGETLKELPDCDSANTTLCDIDPSKLLLENVERSFHGNYSCMGMNAAGWGPVSPNTELVVYYPPGRAKLTYEPERVIKKGRIQLTCSVEDPGRPDNPTYHWFRNYQALQQGPVTANYTIDPVTLETDANFTCSAVNLGGESESDTVHIKVYAPPAFIERLPPYYGALMNAQKISISCRVECSPICSIIWTKNGRVIDQSNTRYSVQTSILRPDTRTNDFESVYSTLIWNMSAWPGNQLDRIHDNSNYTCQSTGNSVGVGVKSTTIFGVEYPPENLTVSNKVVNVIEGNIPEKVLCNAKGYPEPSYNWWREDSSEPVVKGNNALTLNYPVRRRNGGNYVCEAFNRHGNNTIKTFVNVLYKPECGITQSEMDGKLVLICTAHANPTEVDFTWRIKNENETIEENIEKKGLQSFLTLETRVENFRTYLCFTNNSVGMSIPCERDVTGNVAWWRKLENDNLMLLVAFIAGSILVVIIICIIIILVCRKKRAEDKCPNPSSTKDKSDLNSSSPSDALLQPDGDNKAFYENLPFHGMQNPPNKTPTLSDSVTGAAPPVSRPPSELSQYAGSSGYGSTRSQLGPSLQSTEPAANPNSALTDDKKFASLRNCKRSRSDWPQFRSLRASKQSMLPIKENSAETKTKPPAKEPPDTPEPRLKSPPTPAPRKFTPPNCRQTSPKHTYQNIPIPITPNNSSKTEFPDVNSSQSPHCALTNSAATLERQRLLLSANGRQSLKKQQKLLKQHNNSAASRQNSELVAGQDEFVYPSYQRSSNHHIMHSSPPPTYNGGLVYADLTLNHHHHRPHAPVPEHFPLYQPPRPHTEYAIIKFHDVGQEIDV
ncbi:hypothetical protein LSTR_LSTR004370 [Laodelphax striatellus]|uniref:Ig-like domain-containing protein n=1 Tax=Laodelphax striatellus TaxID=195883 RepID=A0A482XA93_LAOST|nr:hypothetical protein LSTR_LSTR004370 [Laodelphax striatellus]